MHKNTLFELVLFDPDDTLITLLEKRGIEFREVPITRKFVVAMDKSIEVFSNENNETLIESLILIFIEWLKEKPYRKLQTQLVDGSIVYIDEYNIENATNIVKSALKITAFDPEYNNRILNRNKDHS